MSDASSKFQVGDVVRIKRFKEIPGTYGLTGYAGISPRSIDRCSLASEQLHGATITRIVENMHIYVDLNSYYWYPEMLEFYPEEELEISESAFEGFDFFLGG